MLNPATAQRSSSRHRAGSRHDLTPLLPLLAAISLLALAAALITDETAGRNILSIDVTIGRWLQRLEIPLGNTIAAFGNTAGSSGFGVPLAIGAAGAMVIARRWTDAIFLFGLLIARGLNAPLKDAASSPRPPASTLHVKEIAEGLGFPSGHTMGIVLLAGGLAYVAFTALPPGRLRVIPCVVTPFVILATAYGRIETGAHWPTDVLGGLLWGTIVLLTAIAVRTYVATHRSLGTRA